LYIKKCRRPGDWTRIVVGGASDQNLKSTVPPWALGGLVKAGPRPSHGDYAWPDQDNGDIAKRFHYAALSDGTIYSARALILTG
jgi:hypothetical protein